MKFLIILLAFTVSLVFAAGGLTKDELKRRLDYLDSIKTQPDFPYRALMLSPTASNTEIESNYRRLALEYHPDRYRDDPNTEQIASELMEIINSAYKTLSDDRERPGYRSTSGGGSAADLIHRQKFHSGYQWLSGSSSNENAPRRQSLRGTHYMFAAKIKYYLNNQIRICWAQQVQVKMI